jgi:hypothetical protein
MPVLFHVPEDVFEHDDGVVDDEADRQRQAQQRDVVDEKPKDTSRQASRSARSAPPPPG